MEEICLCGHGVQRHRSHEPNQAQCVDCACTRFNPEAQAFAAVAGGVVKTLSVAVAARSLLLRLGLKSSDYAKDGPVEALLLDALSLANEYAGQVIEAACGWVTLDKSQWLDTEQVEELAGIELPQALSYLERRGGLVRHADRPELVQLVEVE